MRERTTSGMLMVFRLAHLCPINRVSSTVKPWQSTGPALPSTETGEGQNQLSQMPQVARGKDDGDYILMEELTSYGRTYFIVSMQFK